MGDSIGGGSATTKWTDLKNAVSSLVTSYDSEMRLGAAIFSSDGNCAAATSTCRWPSAAGATVLTKLNAHGPNGNTPTAAALDTRHRQGHASTIRRAPTTSCSATDGRAQLQRHRRDQAHHHALQPDAVGEDLRHRHRRRHRQRPDAAQLVGRRRPHRAHRRDALLPDELAGRSQGGLRRHRRRHRVVRLQDDADGARPVAHPVTENGTARVAVADQRLQLRPDDEHGDAARRRLRHPDRRTPSTKVSVLYGCPARRRFRSRATRVASSSSSSGSASCRPSAASPPSCRPLA